MKYNENAKEILESVGGSDNVKSATHCATRLRLVLKDEELVNEKKLDEVECVKGFFSSGGQFQIIIGAGTVNKVFTEFQKLGTFEIVSTSENKEIAANSQSKFQYFLRKISDIFIPIIPAIVASGLMMGLVNLFGTMGYTPDKYPIIKFLNMFSNAVYIFLPILIGFSATKVFGGNPYLGAAMGAIMVHPDLQNAWTLAQGTKFHVDSYFYVFGLSWWKVPLVGYQGGVLPVIAAAWLVSVFEKMFKKIVPEILDLFLTPLCTILITTSLVMFVIGPLVNIIQFTLINGFLSLIQLPFGIGGFIVGLVYSPSVITGLHQSYAIIDATQLGKYGVTHWLPLAAAANVSQGGSALAIGLLTTKKKMKSVAISGSLSACLGITEPAMFGANLRYKKPFYFAIVGAAVGGLFSAITNLGATGMGVTGIPGILLFLNQIVPYIIMMVISFGVAFVLTLLFGDIKKSDREDSI